MARPKDKIKVLELRRQGMSYSQIRQITSINKSTLSNWLSAYPLPEKRLRELRDWSAIRIEKYINTRKTQREKILSEIYEEEKQSILPLSKRDLFIAGLFLYWGEGSKTSPTQVIMANTDPSVLKTFIAWLQSIADIPKSKLAVRLHLYKDMDIEKETDFWSNTLGIPLSQFRRPYIKDTTFRSITYKGGFGHGTCNVILGDTRLHKRVIMGLKVLRDYFMRA